MTTVLHSSPTAARCGGRDAAVAESGATDRSGSPWLDASAYLIRRLLADASLDPVRLVADALLFAADADCVIVLAPPPEGGRIQPLVAIGPWSSEVASAMLTDAPSLLHHVSLTGEPLHVLDRRGPSSAHRPAADSILLLPLPRPGRHRAVVAVLRFGGRTEFTRRHLESAVGLTRHALVLTELAAARVAQQQLDIVHLRERIADELHDQISRQLFSVGLGLYGVASSLGPGSLADRVAAATIDLDKVIARVRAAALDLADPPPIAPASLHAQVLAVVAELTPSLRFEPTVALSGRGYETTPEIAGAVLDALRRLLTDVAARPRASSVVVVLATTQGHVALEVTDDSGHEHSEKRLSWSTPPQ